MEARSHQKERPFEFLTIYGITLIFAMAFTFYLKMGADTTLHKLNPVNSTDVTEAFASENFSEQQSDISICSFRKLWVKKLYPQ